MNPSTNAEQPANIEPSAASSAKRSGGLATTALIVGIVALAIGVLPILGLAAGITAIILGIKALKASYAQGPSIAGIITGALGALTSLVTTFMFVIVIMGAVNFMAFNQSSPSGESAQQQREAIIQQLEDSQKSFPAGEAAQLGLLEVKVDSVRRDIPVTGLYKYQLDDSEYVHVRMTIKRLASLGHDSVRTGMFALTDRDSKKLTESLPFGPEQEDDLIYEDLAVGDTITRSIVFKIPRGIKNLDLVYTESYTQIKSGGDPSLEELEGLSLDDFETVEHVYRLGI